MVIKVELQESPLGANKHQSSMRSPSMRVVSGGCYLGDQWGGQLIQQCKGAEDDTSCSWQAMGSHHT